MNRLVTALVPSTAAALVRMLGATLRLRIEGSDALVPFWSGARPLIYCVWHGRILMVPWLNTRLRRTHAAFPVLSSRSCPEFCTYCPHRITAPYRARTPGNVLAEIEEICGAPIPYDVDWATFDDKTALNFLDNMSCHRLNMALRVICSDDMGKEAVRDGLKKVRLVNVKTEGEKTMSFEGGVLEMHVPYAMGGSTLISDNEIRALLLTKL